MGFGFSTFGASANFVSSVRSSRTSFVYLSPPSGSAFDASLRFAISRVGTGTQHTWSTLALLWLLPWRTLARHARRRLLNRWANDLLRAITGTAVGEAFAFIQFPVHQLWQRPSSGNSENKESLRSWNKVED